MVSSITISIIIALPNLGVLIYWCFGARLREMEVIDLADLMRKVKLASMPSDVLKGNMSDYAYALGTLKNFADKEQRSVLDLAQDVNLTSTWVRLCEDMSHRVRDFHDMEEYIVARQERKIYRWICQWWYIKKAQRRVVRDTVNIANLLGRAAEHREKVGWAIYNKYGPMRDLVHQLDALNERIVAAETTIIRKIDEINEIVYEFMDMIPSRKEAFELNVQNDAIMEPLVADMAALVVERDALAQRIYDYEFERRRFLHQPPLEAEQAKSPTTPQL